MNDSRREQPEDERPVTNVDTVTGIMSALIPRDDIEPVGKQIDNFSFTFVTPLGADNNYDHVIDS